MHPVSHGRQRVTLESRLNVRENGCTRRHGWQWVDEPVAGCRSKGASKRRYDEAAAQALKARTLTNLYNARPQWLADAQAALDAAVAAAYGWVRTFRRRMRWGRCWG